MTCFPQLFHRVENGVVIEMGITYEYFCHATSGQETMNPTIHKHTGNHIHVQYLLSELKLRDARH
jgi:hypothetical protein